MAYLRRTELFIGIFKDEANTNTDGFLVDGLDYEFDVSRSTEFYKDSATFTIYNPNEDTLNAIMNDGVSVVFKAGYEDEELGVLFVGQIATAYPEEDRENTKIVLICNSQRGAHYPLQRTVIRANVDKGSSCYDVLKLFSDYVEVPLSGAEKLKSEKLSTPYVISGDVRGEIKKFTERHLRSLGGKVIVSNNEMIYIDGKDNATLETAYLSFNTGLISATPVREERYQGSEDAFSENMEYYLGIKDKGDESVKEFFKKKEQNEAKVQKRNIVEFVCLVNAAVEVGKPVYIDARKSENDHRSVLGKFYVESIRAQGDNFGGQYQMDCRAEERA